MKVQYVGVPAPVKREVDQIVQRYKSAMPGWLNHVLIEYVIRAEVGEPGDGAIAMIDVKYEYRYATIRICGDQWERPGVDKERVIVHELCHCLVAPIEKLAHSLLDARDETGANDPADPLLEAMYEQTRMAMESSVEDTAQALVAAWRAGNRSE
jgi:hypothetical protein